MPDKKADLAGPGIGDYDELEQILPDDYTPLLPPKETQKAHLGECSVTVWPKILKHMCKQKNIHVLE
jgi:hypothetical protein